MTTTPNNLTSRPIIAIEQAKLEAGESFEVGSFFLNGEGIFHTTKEKGTGELVTRKISEPLFIKHSVQNLDSQVVELVLCYKYKGKYLERNIGLIELNPIELLKLLSFGVDVTHTQVKLVASFLQEQQKRAPHQELFQEVGWHEDEEMNLVFRHHRVHPYSVLAHARNDSRDGKYNLEPHGELSVFLNMIQEEVMGNTALEAALCMGFSAPLVGYLSKKYSDIGTLLIHIVGDSTKGKTTAALLAISPFGDPSSKEKGLMKTWNGTGNAIINQLAENHGIPVVLDELSMSTAQNLTSEIYVLTHGVEKSRLNEYMKQRKQGKWATTLISNGEQSLSVRTNQNTGLSLRLMELPNVEWTSSAKNADAIRKIIQDHYGHAGEEFLAYIFAEGVSLIEEKWDVWQKRFIDLLPPSQFRSRIAKKYGILLAAGDLANESLHLGLDLEAILLFFVQNEKEQMSARDIGGKALDFITQEIIQHQANFRREGSYHSPLNCWGKMFIHPDGVEVAFLKNVLEHQLRLGGFEDAKIVIRDWKEKGLLLTEGDRSTKRTKIFEASEQAERQKIHGSKPVPSKLQDTTYNIKLPLDTLEGLIEAPEQSLDLTDPSSRFTI
ncbi:DUF927 domain-containing protein [Sporosarcina ureae]|uniref:DUF927 domain-containing protein n=1 Tax=Sporosarcina ureae TaxID=1571 RepID=UPI000A17A1F5|nr:DUF927 domain-containing protein [Sporosarcina ureae]ARK22263.1 hypothetical protein SporoP32a_12440 [Sporosarcina ureae]